MSGRVPALLASSLFSIVLGLGALGPTPSLARALTAPASPEPPTLASAPHIKPAAKQTKTRKPAKPHHRPRSAASKASAAASTPPPQAPAKSGPLDGLKRWVVRIGAKTWLSLGVILALLLFWLSAHDKAKALKGDAAALDARLARAVKEIEQARIQAERARADAAQARLQTERLRAELDARRSKSRASWIERQALEAIQPPEDPEEIDWPARQMALLSEVIANDPHSLHRRPVLNGGERLIFEACAAWADKRGLRAAPQTCVGAFVGTRVAKPRGKAVHGAYNSKRVDVLICTNAWWPLIVVEHQGAGHSQGDGDRRFAVKQMVFDNILLTLVETGDDDKIETIQAKLEIAWKAAKRANKLYWPAHRSARDAPGFNPN